MGTRGAIARVIDRSEGLMGFEGRYHHWDSYPEGLGKTLFQLYNGYFAKDMKKFLQVLIDDHPAGWSTINDGDFSLPAGFMEFETRQKLSEDAPHGPQCYCHGDRHEEGSSYVTEKNASDSGCEWVYAIDAKKGVMYVLSSYTQVQGKETKMIGFFGCGDPNAVWKPVATVDLAGAEPDWKEINRAGS